jgi:hypothetical protein
MEQSEKRECRHYLRPWVRSGEKGATLWAVCQMKACRRQWFISDAIPSIASRGAKIEADMVADQLAEQEQRENDLAAAS